MKSYSFKIKLLGGKHSFFNYLLFLTIFISLLLPTAYASIPQVVIPTSLTTTIIINGTASGTCPSGYAIQNLTGTGLQCVLMPSSANAQYQFLNNNFNGSGNFNTTGDIEVRNIKIDGNFSAKRAYFSGYDNSTQNFINVANTQVVNITNNNEYDGYQINITNKQNITFQSTGDYIITFMPEFTLTSGTNNLIAFWLQKNGVDVPWTNTRVTIKASGDYNAPNIVYHINVENPSTEWYRIMWWSDSTNTQIVSIAGLTNPTRPSVPGVIIEIQKISELTP